MVKSALTSPLKTSVVLELNATSPVICYYKTGIYIGIFKYLYWNNYILIWFFHKNKCLPSKWGRHVTVKKYLKLFIYSIYFSGFWEKKSYIFKLSASGHGIYFLWANLKYFFPSFICHGSRALHSRALKSQKQIICSQCIQRSYSY